MKLKLLAVGTNAKTVKGDGSQYLTAILYLAPYNTVGGINVCSMAKLAECHVPCLYTAGRGAYSNVQSARQRKTIQWRDNREEFLRTLCDDLAQFQRYCDKKDITPCVRLNGTSDIRWENYNIPQLFPKITFYDYTKDSARVSKPLPENYHLTLSYSEANVRYSEMTWDAARKSGANVAVVFRSKEAIPRVFRGRAVVDGDRDDLRFLDPKGVVVALYAKGRAKHDESGFVVD